MSAETIATRTVLETIDRRIERMKESALSEREQHKKREQQGMLDPHDIYEEVDIDSQYMHRYSSIDKYFEDFGKLISLRTVLRRLSRVTEPVVIDVMSSTAALGTLFTRLPNRGYASGLAVGYDEDRSPRILAEDTENNITKIAGDVNHRSTVTEINRWLNGRRANLILYRPIGAINMVPHTAQYLNLLLKQNWRWLSSENGLLLCQTPNAIQLEQMGIDYKRWQEMCGEQGIKTKFIEEVGLSNGSLLSGLLSIEKTSQDAQLPNLPGETTHELLLDYSPIWYRFHPRQWYIGRKSGLNLEDE